LCCAVSCDTGNVPSESEIISSKTSSVSERYPTSTTPTTDNQVLSEYKVAYLDFLKDKKESHRLFSLVYIDNDDIPELYLSGVSEAEGDMICSFKNGVVVYQYLSRIGGGKYVEKSESIINQNGHMGQYYDNVYKLDENGFSEVLNARYKEIYEHIGNEEYNIYYEYFIDDTAVSEVEYNNAVNAAFDFSKAISFYDNAVSYEKIVEQLGGDNSVG
jgi:hypothetical protein